MTYTESCIEDGVKSFRGKVFGCLKRIFNFKNLFTTHNSQFTKLAFTLAETLIVMGIIGVVAALTLPNLNSSTGDKEKVAKVKKIYNNLTDAIGRAEAVYGPFSEWGVDLPSGDGRRWLRVGERISEFLKVQKVCGIADKEGSGCFNKSAKMYSIEGAEVSPYILETGGYHLILADGTSLILRYRNSDVIDIMFDIDGPNKGPYVYGKDLFGFSILEENGNGDYNFTYELKDNEIVKQCRTYEDNDFVEYGSCIQWILKNDNMDYLKTDKDGKCTNNTSIVLNGVTNTTCK